MGALLVVAAVLFHAACGRPSYDPDRVAELETRMWRSYYDGDRTELGLLLVALLRTQYGLSLLEAKEIGELLARSAMEFRAARGQYEKAVLPDLRNAYALIKRATGASFDPDEVAAAELAWWVARRTPGANAPEQVGDKIGELYCLLYGSELPAFREAGRLRARAAALRDQGGRDADWRRVEELLRESYRTLGKGVGNPSGNRES